MVATVASPALIGLDVATVRVEVDLRPGLPSMAVVGLPDAAVREARDRVRSGLANQGYGVPAGRVVASLAPSDLRKAGAQYDLPLALALLAASGQLAARALEGVAAAGELGLDGRLRPVAGVLAMAEYARARGWRRLVVPAANGAEAGLVAGVEVIAAEGLRAAVEMLLGQRPAPAVGGDAGQLLERAAAAPGPDLAEVRGQATARRALEIAAAGRHSLMLMGSPGGGKTMLARRLPGVLPPLTPAEAVEITRIHSAAGRLPGGGGLITTRPFRAPHHSISAAGLVGGGRLPRPGEVTLAHRGVLFLDELPAFAPSVLDALRQPLEEGWVEVSRAMASVRFPAAPLLVCAGNPCPCGFSGDRERSCRCAPGQAATYLARISGPVRDRLDLWVDVPRLSGDELGAEGAGEASAAVRARVVRAVEDRDARGQEAPNGALDGAAGRRVARASAEARALLGRAVRTLGLSARGYDRVLRVARTIADLEGAASVTEGHVAEALALRPPPGAP